MYSKFGENPFLQGKPVKYNFLVTIFFSDKRREQTPGRILMLDGSKDAKSCMDVSFGLKYEKLKFEPYLLPKR